jgi:hypothetical protein
VTEPCTVLAQKDQYELRFAGVSSGKRGYAFPCDETGRVDIDELTDRDRTNYFYARTVVGKELSAPIVAPVSTGHRLDALSVRSHHVSQSKSS